MHSGLWSRKPDWLRASPIADLVRSRNADGHYPQPANMVHHRPFMTTFLVLVGMFRRSAKRLTYDRIEDVRSEVWNYLPVSYRKVN